MNYTITLIKDKMNYYLTRIAIFLFATFVFQSCQEQTDLEKLNERRKELRSELTKLEEQIRDFDTLKKEFIPLVKTQEVDFGTFNHFVTVQGEVRTDQEITINAEANGVIRKINYKEGEFVKKGAVIAEIDSEILKSNLNELETQLEFAQYNYDKQKELLDKGVGTEFELKQAKNNLNSLKSQLQTLKTQKSKSLVVAPFDGYVDEVFARTGEMAGAQSPIIRLVNNSEVRVSASISENYYTRIEKGTPVRAYFPSLKDTLDLEITAVGNYIHPTNRTFRVQANIDSNKLLLPNMLAQMRIRDQKIDSVFIVPSQSILKTQENEDYIFIVAPEKDYYKVNKVFVDIINRQEGKAAIKVKNNSLEKGYKVVTEGGRGITNNDIVRLI